MESQSTVGTTLLDVTAKLRQWPCLLIWKQRFLSSSFRMDVYKFVPSTLVFRRKTEVREERNAAITLML